ALAAPSAIAVSFSDIRTQTLSNLLAVGFVRCWGLLHTRTRCASAGQPELLFAARPRPSPVDQLQFRPLVQKFRSKCASLVAAPAWDLLRACRQQSTRRSALRMRCRRQTYSAG